MASNRNVILLVLGVFLAACTASKTVQAPSSTKKNQSSQSASSSQKPTTENTKTELDYDLDKYRNTLADLNTTKNNNLPQQLVVEEVKEVVSNDFSQNGYRIQLVSTSDRARAEKVIADYNDWLFANESITYKAESYIIFRQPNYRVHVGDFKSRIQATEFNKVIKRKFPDAWIIQDQINEEKTPDNMK